MTDLSDFGGGIDQHHQNEEDTVKLELTNWLNRGGVDVYWERNRSYGRGTFTVEGTQGRRPDLLINSQNRTYAVEIKIGNASGDIHEGVLQTYRYWQDIVEDRATYKTQERTVEVDAVLIGSQYSKVGRIYHNTRRRDPKQEARSEGAQRVAGDRIPSIEHAASDTLMRVLWQFAKDYDETASTGIGELLSSALDGDDVDRSIPAAAFYQPGERYSQNWEYIPFYEK